MPDSKGKVSVTLTTNGYGGQTVKKTIKVHTNDPEQKIIGLEMTGDVKVFASVEPGIAELSGNVGEPIGSTIIITPAVPEMDFKIAQITARDNSNIRFEIRRNDEIIPAFYELTIENIKQKPGRYFDLITIWTNTSRKIYIRVFGNIFP